MMHAVRAASVLGLVLLLQSGSALAQNADEDAARGLFREGLAQHEARDFAGALEKYRSAYARWKNPKILANIGTVCWELGRFAEAANAYDRFLADTPADSPDRADVEKALADVVPKVGLLEISPNDPKLVLTVDGHAVEFAAPGRLYVEPGAHQLQARADGGSAASQSVSATAGAKSHVVFLLTPSTQPAVAAGPRAVAPTRAKHSALPFILAGVGVAGVATSGVFYALRNGEASDLKKVCIGEVCPESARSTIDSANTYGTVSLVALGVGVAGLGTAVWLFLNESSEPKPSQTVQLDITAAPGAAGMVAHGRF